MEEYIYSRHIFAKYFTRLCSSTTPGALITYWCLKDLSRRQSGRRLRGFTALSSPSSGGRRVKNSDVSLWDSESAAVRYRLSLSWSLGGVDVSEYVRASAMYTGTTVNWTDFNLWVIRWLRCVLHNWWQPGFRWWPGFPLEVRVARVSVGGHGFRLLPGFPLVARIFVYAQMSTFTSVKIPKRLQRWWASITFG